MALIETPFTERIKQQSSAGEEMLAKLEQINLEI